MAALPQPNHRRTPHSRSSLRVLAGIGWLICLCVAWSTPVRAQQPAPADDAIGLATLDPAQASDATDASGAGPMQISVLDVLTRLALLVLAVYGIAWGIGVVRKSGLRIGRTSLASQNVRLRECERLVLAPGVTLHVIELDHRTALVASGNGGDVRLLLDMAASPEPAETPAEHPRRPLASPGTASTERLAFTLRDDAEWQERRDALIRSLARGE